MHYKGHLITDKLPTGDAIRKILKKYSEYEPGIKKFEYDWYVVGGRYGGRIKIKFNPEENEDNYCLFKHRNNKYFISSLINKLDNNTLSYDELDILKYMGLNDNILYVDGGYYKDMIDFELDNCYVIITEDEAIPRQIWNGEDWIDNDATFIKKVSEISLENKFITVIDFHD